MNETEVNGRITMLEAQRNAALNQTVIDAGTIAVLRAKVAELEATVSNPDNDAASSGTVSDAPEDAPA